jgi:hypothetical protein
MVQQFDDPSDTIGIDSQNAFDVDQDHLTIDLRHFIAQVIGFFAIDDVTEAPHHRGSYSEKSLSVKPHDFYLSLSARQPDADKQRSRPVEERRRFQVARQTR